MKNYQQGKDQDKIIATSLIISLKGTIVGLWLSANAELAPDHICHVGYSGAGV